MGPKPPTDLDGEAKKKWRELVEYVDPDLDSELLANYCRQHGSLMAIRLEKARQIKSRTFETMVPGRDKSMQLNPLLTAESRLVASLNRQLRTLGLAPSRDQQEHRKKVRPTTPPPPGMTGGEPSHGWVLEIALSRSLPGEPMRDEALERAWDEWLTHYRTPGGKQ